MPDDTDAPAGDLAAVLDLPQNDAGPHLADVRDALALEPETPDEPASTPAAKAPAGRVKRWSKTKKKGASKAELVRRLEELEEMAESAPAKPAAAASAPAAPPPTPAEQLAESEDFLRELIPALEGVAVELRGERWQLDKSKREMLVSGYAPLLAPKIGTVRAGAPWITALVVTWLALREPVMSELKAYRAARAAAAAPEASSTAGA
jgi:hypothetical protein